jgi:alkylation response protein AidB-like acyl-CoA dehydrogenase
MKRLGVHGLAIPAPWGEAPVSVPCFALVTAELARGWMSLAGAMGGHTVVARLLVEFGTREQQDRYLPKLATGEIRATMALTEPGGGSDLQAMTTTARHGYSTEYDVERYFRDAPLMIVGEGTSEIQRNVIAAQLVARRGLG